MRIWFHVKNRFEKWIFVILGWYWEKKTEYLSKADHVNFQCCHSIKFKLWQKLRVTVVEFPKFCGASGDCTHSAISNELYSKPVTGVLVDLKILSSKARCQKPRFTAKQCLQVFTLIKFICVKRADDAVQQPLMHVASCKMIETLQV